MSKPNEKPSPLPLVLWSIVCLTIVLAIIGGLMMTGGPEGQRKQRMDAERARDLTSLKSDVEQYYVTHKRLPDSLQGLKTNKRGDTRRDPVTHKPYTYQKHTDVSFGLCADFDTDTLQETTEQRPYDDSGAVYLHPTGHYCYTLVTEDANPSAARRFRWIAE